jgi:uncharacterized membrane protein (Fun14 family)
LVLNRVAVVRTNWCSCALTAEAANLSQVVENLVSTAITNPYVAAAMAIQFLLGLGLGYVIAKAAKYVLAFIGLLVLGAALNVWSLNLTVEDLVRILGEKGAEIKDTIMWLVQVIGLMTLGPASLGFILGVVIALFRR